MICQSGSTLTVEVTDDDGASLEGAEVSATLETLAGVTLATLLTSDFALSDDKLSAAGRTAEVDYAGTTLLRTVIRWVDGAVTTKSRYVSFE